MGKRPTEDETAALLHVFDADGNGAIEIGEFEHMVRQQLNLPPTAMCPCNVCEKRRAEEEEERRLADELNASLASELRLKTGDSTASVGDVSVSMRSTASAPAKKQEKLRNFVF